jgi:hypothetical protein
MSAAMAIYAAKLRSGERFSPFPEGEELSQTEVAIVVSELLEAGDMEIFELALWRIWGRT